MSVSWRDDGDLAVCTEFDCEGCGVHVVALGRATAPKDGFCATCQALHWPESLRMSPDEWWAAYRRLRA